jgi:hypothetical protein
MRSNSLVVMVLIPLSGAGSVVSPDSRPAFFGVGAGFTILVYHSDYYRTKAL